MDMKLELVPLSVSDVDASIVFYAQKAGFHLDHDIQPGNGMRIVQFTPPGSACSIAFGTGMGDGETSVHGLHLVVKDIAKARQMLVDRGVEVSDINDMGGVKYAYFSDPDDNSWTLQEISPSARP
jgi:catechol 2,3-dioxygenase-like lactoylglutathione lyase family enzyme